MSQCPVEPMSGPVCVCGDLDSLGPDVRAAGGHDLLPAFQNRLASGHGLPARVHARGHVDAAALLHSPDALHGGSVALAEGAVKLGVALEDA